MDSAYEFVIVDCSCALLSQGSFDIFISIFFLADLKEVLSDEEVYYEAAMEAFPVYNKSHMICLEMPSRAGDVS